MKKKLDFSKYLVFKSSLIEKYSFAFLQLISTLILTKLFGFSSLGLVAAYSLIISISTVLSEAGSSILIMRSSNLKNSLVANSFKISIVISSIVFCICFLLVFMFGHKVEANTLNGFYFYSSLIFFSPLQLISNSVLVQQRKFKSIFRINIQAWLMSITITFLIWFFIDKHKNVVLVYFIVLNFLRFIFAFKLIKMSTSFLMKTNIDFNLNYRISLISSQLFNSISNNIWTTIIAIRLNLDANAVYSLFVKLRDISIGNLSHSLHRIIIKNINKNLFFKNPLVFRGFLLMSIASIGFFFLTWLTRNFILEIFNHTGQKYDEIILVVLIVAIFYPISDYLKALLKKHKQKLVFILDLILVLTILILVLLIEDIYTLLTCYVIIQGIISSIFFYYAKKN